MFGMVIYTTVAQAYSLLTVASHTELRCSSAASDGASGRNRERLTAAFNPSGILTQFLHNMGAYNFPR